MKRIYAISILSCALVMLCASLSAQSFRIESHATSDKGHRAKRPNVMKELKLSPAQREEIAAIVASMKNDTRSIRRKLDALKEDYKSASLAEKTDEKELLRIQSDILSTRNEINAVALKKMAEIKQLLTAGQASKLADLRKAERERIEAEQKSTKGDVSTDNMRQVPTFQSFTMQSFSSSSDESYFSADDLFVYPERELWMDRSSAGAFSFSSDDDSENNLFPGFEQFFDGNGGRFNFRMPQFKHFNFDNKSEKEDDNDSDLMDDTPYTLPKEKKKPSGSDSAPRLKKQLEELRQQLKKLEQKVDEEDKK